LQNRSNPLHKNASYKRMSNPNPQFLKTKTLHRASFITHNALRQLLVSLYGMAIPFIVIRYVSKEIWGTFVSPLLFCLLALQIINWGNKEYLLRQFSVEPSAMARHLSANATTRFFPALVLGSIALLYFPLVSGVFIFLWIIGRFLSHSTEALVIYEKAFQASIRIETVGFIFFCIVFLSFNNPDAFVLLVVYSLYQLIKGIGYLWHFRDYIDKRYFNFDRKYYSAAFPFFLLSILGFFASKADVYLVENLGNAVTTSDYQIINSLLVFVMSVSAFLYAPFTKNIYRMTIETTLKSKRWLAASGLLIVPPSLLAIHCILRFYADIRLPLLFYVVAFLYVLPTYLYGIEIVSLFRQKKEKKVVAVLFIGTAVNTALSALFLYLDYGITGALAGSAISQWLILLLFKLRFENKTDLVPKS
jgi:hypothetical protein